MRIGIIGCGEIGSLRATAINEMDSWRVVAASDVDPTRARSFSKRFGAAVDNWHSLVSRQDLDAVLICTPPNLHAEMCIEALTEGKHVLCEKPLARSTAEARRMVEVARNSGRFLATGFNYRFFPSVEKTSQWIENGSIGAVRFIRSYAGYSAADHGRPWVHDVSVTGGGALRDNGIHLIDLTRYFLGEVHKAYGFAANSVWEFPGCEDNGFLYFQTDDRKMATLHASWTEWKKYRFQLEIYGNEGMIRLSCFPMLAELVRRSAYGQKAKRLKHWFPANFVMEHLRSHRWIAKQSFVKELDSFHSAIQGTHARIATGHDGMRAIELAEAATPLFAAQS